jgi:hypothetical protein
MIATDRPQRATVPAAVCLPAAVRRHGSVLLNQQFWLWGQDIRRPEGNLLLGGGFERARPPGAAQGSRCYTLRLDGGRTVALWGFGLFYGDDDLGGLYLSRFRLLPLLSENADPPASVWAPNDLPPFASPASMDEWERARPLLVAALLWISAYESRTLELPGLTYRRRCLAGAPRPNRCPSDGPVRWRRLAVRCDATMRRALGMSPVRRGADPAAGPANLVAVDSVSPCRVACHGDTKYQ